LLDSQERPLEQEFNQSTDQDQPEGIRINKYLADTGYCSRREADRLIAAGLVTIDEAMALIGSRVLDGQVVRVNGEPVLRDEDLVYIALYKPIGITTTTDSRRGDNIIDFLNYPKRVFPIGRLDRDSEGLIFLTNDGNIVNKILRAGNRHEKEYRVKVDHPITDEFVQSMMAGVPILDTVTLPCRVIPESNRTFRIILTQGLNRQIRRMCEALGYDVVRLTRLRIMHVALGSMKPGDWRYLSPKEVSELKRLTQNSWG
jgi:23S rRNA pseudouridine2604 synthase